MRHGKTAACHMVHVSQCGCRGCPSVQTCAALLCHRLHLTCVAVGSLTYDLVVRKQRLPHRDSTAVAAGTAIEVGTHLELLVQRSQKQHCPATGHCLGSACLRAFKPGASLDWQACIASVCARPAGQIVAVAGYMCACWPQTHRGSKQIDPTVGTPGNIHRHFPPIKLQPRPSPGPWLVGGPHSVWCRPVCLSQPQ